MNHLVCSIALALCAATTAASAQTAAKHHVLRVGDFTKLTVVNALNVNYKSHPDSAGMAVFDAPADMVNAVMFSNNGKGKLTVTTDVADRRQQRPLPVVTVYSRSLVYIENRGDSTVRASDINAGPKFKASLEGNGRLAIHHINANEVNGKVFTGRGQLAIDGRCTKARLTCYGVGTIQADGLEATDVTATVNGTCDIGCCATGTLTVQGTGPGTVYYLGTPALIKNRSINAKTSPL